MGRLIGERLLQAWERIRAYPQEEAALALLALAWPQRDLAELARLSLGERNVMLLELRAASLGRRIEAFAVCPECGAQLELALDAHELVEGLRSDQVIASAGTSTYAMRAANTLDLIAARDGGDEKATQTILLSRTMLTAEGGDSDDSAGEWLSARPEVEKSALVEQFEQVNAAAEIRVAVECAACRASEVLDLDIAQFFLRELASAARRLMEDVHQLAMAYGWSERSIVNMSTARRALYLEMVGA